MGRRTKGWLFGGWLVLVVAGWSVTESVNDGIEPTSGPRPEPSSSSSSAHCGVLTPTQTPTQTPIHWPTPMSSAHAEDSGIFDYYVDAEPDSVATVVVTAVACKTAD